MSVLQWDRENRGIYRTAAFGLFSDYREVIYHTFPLWITNLTDLHPRHLSSLRAIEDSLQIIAEYSVEIKQKGA